jgi:hypothetical protein
MEKQDLPLWSALHLLHSSNVWGVRSEMKKQKLVFGIYLMNETESYSHLQPSHGYRECHLSRTRLYISRKREYYF